MNAVLLLMGLLVLSYLGSFLVGGRTVRGAGLAVGRRVRRARASCSARARSTSWAADMLASFEPVVQVALGWLAFAVGLDFGYAGDKRVPASAASRSARSGALVTGGAVAGGHLARRRAVRTSARA